jgi:hypothetical protein
MSKEAKNEIDLMLRQLGRRDGAVYSDEQHLDADELNSYVANALPSAARARYMEHLADCASCRRLVAQLSAAQGPVVVPHTESITAPSGIKQFLASLLSPMVLRYAVPALGVIVVMVVSVVMWRRESAPDSLARIVQTDQKKSEVVLPSGSPESTVEGFVQQDPGHPAELPAPKASSLRGESAGAAAGTHTEQSTAAPVTANEPPAATPETRVYDSVTVAPAKVAPAEEEDAQRRADSEKKKAIEDVKREKLAEVTVKQRDELNKAQQPQQTQASAESARAAAPSVSVARVAKSGETTGAGERAQRSPKEGRGEVADKAARRDYEAKDKNDVAPETRSIAGRRFRKSGNVWIDTAYSSQQTVTYARGSEQYRALVGDEPEIRQIAEQLDGEFIVVWKGRAYRIR